MMHSTGHSALAFFWILHMVSALALLVGLIFLFIWTFKHMNEKNLRSWGWKLVIAGIVGCLLTAIAAPFTADGPQFRFGQDGRRGMMWQDSEEQTTDNAGQTKEEADGKALYDKLQTKQTTCAALTNADFELIGEYVMGQQLGASHEQMNTRIKTMMGTDAEAQMHMNLGKGVTGCASGTQTNGAMMNGGMMQKLSSSSAR